MAKQELSALVNATQTYVNKRRSCYSRCDCATLSSAHSNFQKRQTVLRKAAHSAEDAETLLMTNL